MSATELIADYYDSALRKLVDTDSDGSTDFYGILFTKNDVLGIIAEEVSAFIGLSAYGSYSRHNFNMIMSGIDGDALLPDASYNYGDRIPPQLLNDIVNQLVTQKKYVLTENAETKLKPLMSGGSIRSSIPDATALGEYVNYSGKSSPNSALLHSNNNMFFGGIITLTQLNALDQADIDFLLAGIGVEISGSTHTFKMVAAGVVLNTTTTPPQLEIVTGQEYVLTSPSQALVVDLYY